MDGVNVNRTILDVHEMVIFRDAIIPIAPPNRIVDLLLYPAESDQCATMASSQWKNCPSIRQYRSALHFFSGLSTAIQTTYVGMQ